MKNNKWNLVSAILNLVAFVFFMMTAVFQTVALAKGLFCVAGLCSLISSIGFFYNYVKNNKSKKDNSKYTESLG